MKKILLFIMFSITLISCNKDDDSGTPASILGDWNLTKLNINSQNTYVEDGITFIFLLAAEGTEYNATTSFSENPNIIEATGSVTLQINSYLNGIPVGQEVQTLDINEEFNSGTWELNDNILTIYEGDNNSISTEFTVETLTHNKLVITYVEEIVEAGISTSIDGRYEFSR